MAILGNQQGQLLQVPIYNYEKTHETAKSINVRCDFAVDTVFSGNLSQEKRNGVFQSIRSIYFNCDGCANDVTFTCVDTGQSLTFKAGTQGYLPVLVSAGMSFRFVGVSPDVGIFNLLNVDMPPAIWPEGAASGPFPFSDIEMTGPALLGRYTAGLGPTEEVLLGAGLSFVGDTLTMGAGGPYVLKAGDTMTGLLTINLATFAAPSVPADTILHLNGLGTGSQSRFVVDAISNNSRAVWAMRRARDAGSGVPSAVQSSDGLGAIGAFGYGATAYTSSARAGVDFEASENWTDTLQGARVGFRATSNGSTLSAIRAYIQNGFWTLNATGGDQGIDTINAVNYFDDGVNINTIYAGLAAANIFTNAAGQTVIMTGAPSAGTVSGGALRVESQDAGVTGVIFNSYHNSASPAANDTAMSIQTWGNNSTPAAIRYGIFRCTILDPNAGSEDGLYSFFTMVAGTLAQRLAIGAGVYTANATGGDQGADTINAANYYASGNIIADTNGLLRNRVFTAGTLPAATAGANAQVSNATQTLTAGIGAIVAGGGANNVPVNADGANWRIG